MAERKQEQKEGRKKRGGEGGRRVIIIGLAVGDGVVLLLGGTCVFEGGVGWRLWGKCRGH